ncbi:hypothetical protein ABT237_12905 [Streptomyces sp. NPDC001581]|uniref:hypothetical protein n=1 Tax=Streptomyces sp. NPDC001581 TaxID=3154386 RepID=UPI00331AE4BA
MPTHRLAVRSFLGGPNLAPADLAMVLLVREDDDDKPRPMPTVTVREIGGMVKALESLGVGSVKIFAGSRVRDSRASQGASPTSLMARAIKAAKRAAPKVLVMTETCVCSHNDSGECWLADKGGRIDVEETIEALGLQAIMQAEAGADIVGPASMIPDSVRWIRQELDGAGHQGVGIMPHLIFESSLYEGYRTSMGAVPRSGSRAFQINPAHPDQAVHVAQQMVEEGADMILTEPALHTVDTLVQLKDKVAVPIVPFSVSGEYLRLTDRRDDGERDVKGLIESYTVLKRAGAARIITYGALDIARALKPS